MEPEAFELEINQSALILEADEQGEISVTVASRDHRGITGALCRAIAQKLMNDEQFQTDLMAMLDIDEESEL